MTDVAAIFEAAFRKLKPRTPLPAIQVEFRPYANVNSSVRLRDGRMVVRLSDLLQAAPPPVLQALALILISKLYRLPVAKTHNNRFRRFLNRREVRRQTDVVRRVRGRKHVATAAGEYYNLEEVFDRLNNKYFQGFLPRPALSWSRSRSRTMLGHFDPAHNTIVISRIFDSAGVPRYTLEYLMYHEMLHVKYPVEYGAGRRRVHSETFQQDERRFEFFQAARTALKKLALSDPHI